MKRWFYVLCCAAALFLSSAALAQWRPLGPFGGNARALAFDPTNPDHILLGSGAGALFESMDGGRHWKHFAHLGTGQDLMLENIAFDPSQPTTIYVAGWSVTGSGGGFFVTRDGGRSWNQPGALWGKSIQAVALAESDPRILIAGALDGLYRSTDRGDSWVRISPAKHPDLKNFESVAIDPRDPKIIYAGTWHLPWKTSDGGLTWSNIKQGVIDDSDVFSIILDHANPQTVFASACSGIYKSDNGGELFRKVQGIPGSARRTRVLQQDPADPNTVYAGTTEGLWKTSDGGKSFKLISPPNFILNDVLVDPRDSRRVLIATDRGGVFTSDDGGLSFRPSNDGFSQRQITAVLTDSQQSVDLYAAVLNDKEFGGVFRQHDGVWSQVSDGLAGRDVFDLRQAASGRLVAATNHGLFLFAADRQRWEISRDVVRETAASRRKPIRGKNGKWIVPKPLPATATHATFEGRASALSLTGRRWYAATDAGILVSENEGRSWKGGEVDGEKVFYSVSAYEETVAAASIREVWVSRDGAEHWARQPIPSWVTRIYTVAVTPDGEEWVASREGGLHWNQQNREWVHVFNGLPARDVTSIRAEGDLLLASVVGSKTVYVSQDHGQSWKPEPAAPFEITGATIQGSLLFVTTAHHGLLLRDVQGNAFPGIH